MQHTNNLQTTDKDNLIHYPVKTVSQKEQEGGFWLFSVTLHRLYSPLKQGGGGNTPPLPEIVLGSDLVFENSENPLFLFQQNQTKQHITLQLLSAQALPSPAPSTLKVFAVSPASQALLEACQSAPNVILLGSEAHIAHLFYLAKYRSHQPNIQTLALLHCQTAFPFKAKPALLMAPHLPPQAIGTSQLLEDWKIPNRLASQQDLAGCFDGTLDEFFTYWLTQKNKTLQTDESWQVIIFASNKTQKKCLTISQSYDWIKAQAL